MVRSKLHLAALSAIQGSDIFRGQRVQEEVNVRDLFKDYTANNQHYDIVLPDLKCIIELHGKQHYVPTDFTGKDAGKALLEFQLQVERDQDKREVAILAGWTYIEIPYTAEKDITPEYIYNKYIAAQTHPVFTKEVCVALKQEILEPKPSRFRLNEEQKQKVSQYRKEQYKRSKEFKNANKRSSKGPAGPSEEET